MEQGLTWSPKVDHDTEYLDVALANEMLANHDGAGKEIAHFLTRLTKLGEMVLKLKNGEAEDGGVAALRDAAREAFASLAPPVRAMTRRPAARRWGM